MKRLLLFVTYPLLVLFIGLVVLTWMAVLRSPIPVLAQGGSECEQSPDCVLLDEPGQEGIYENGRDIAYAVIKAGQNEFTFYPGFSDDGCYLVYIEDNWIEWSRYGEGRECQEISHIQLWKVQDGNGNGGDDGNGDNGDGNGDGDNGNGGNGIPRDGENGGEDDGNGEPCYPTFTITALYSEATGIPGPIPDVQFEIDGRILVTTDSNGMAFLPDVSDMTGRTVLVEVLSAPRFSWRFTEAWVLVEPCAGVLVEFVDPPSGADMRGFGVYLLLYGIGLWLAHFEYRATQKEIERQ